MTDQADHDWRAYSGKAPEAKVEPDSNHRYSAAIDVVVDGRFRVGVCAGGKTVTELVQDVLRQAGYYCTPEYVKDVGQPHFRITVPVSRACSSCYGRGRVFTRPGASKICPTCKGKNSQEEV
jgi:hypothetical protein